MQDARQKMKMEYIVYTYLLFLTLYQMKRRNALQVTLFVLNYTAIDEIALYF